MKQDLPDRKSQILAVHAGFIHMVVLALHDPGKRAEMEQHLQTAENNGWQGLVSVIRRIAEGETGPSLLSGLDEEDKVIVQAILLGRQNPENLPPIPKRTDPSVAAPGLANLIRQASSGDVDALEALGVMAGQMSAAGGTMARVGASIKKLLDGERDLHRLTNGMDDKGHSLIASILAELEQTTIH